MKVLAFDSSGAACSAAIRDDEGRLLAYRFQPMARGHAELLMPMLRDVMAEAGLAFGGLDLIAATIGPGSFTGIRVGLAAARGLALASGLPLLGVTAFEAIAAGVSPDERRDAALMVAIDSRRDDLFIQCFAADGATLSAPAALAPAALADAAPMGDLLLAGDGAARARDALAALGRRSALLARASGPPDAADVAGLAVSRWHPGTRPAFPLPLYLRPPDVTMPGARRAPP
jgi:tRNA threonylcarbamoyladenosine biosynthesis protein TsaB